MGRLEDEYETIPGLHIRRYCARFSILVVPPADPRVELLVGLKGKKNVRESCQVRFHRAILCLLVAFSSSASSAKEKACSEQLGEQESKQLVEWCIDASPATHPPCNSQNSCALIVSEIKRGCGFFKDSKAPPAYCLLTYPSNP